MFYDVGESLGPGVVYGDEYVQEKRCKSGKLREDCRHKEKIRGEQCKRASRRNIF